MIATLGLALLAGVLTALSPCVLPLLPIVLGTAQSEHRLGPIALAAGLALSFVAIGLFVATIGFAAGLDTGAFRAISAMLLIAVGRSAVGAQATSAVRARRKPGEQLGRRSFRRHHRDEPRRPIRSRPSARSPCVEPTLGAASILAAKGENLGQAALTMLVFGIGAALPLMLIGLLSREAMMRWRGP
jgi:cytochrome c-type biogenesis protein